MKNNIFKVGDFIVENNRIKRRDGKSHPVFIEFTELISKRTDAESILENIFLDRDKFGDFDPNQSW